MPGRRRYNNKSNYKKKINTAFKLARNNRRMMMGETKIQDTVLASDDIDILGTVLNLTDMDQGLLAIGTGGVTTNATRIGREVYAKSLTLRFRIKWLDTGLENTIRILLVQKLSDDNDAPTILSAGATDVLRDVTSGIDVLSPPSWQNRHRYKILMDETLIGDPQRQENIVFKRFFKFRHKIVYAGTTGLVVKQGGLFLIWFGDSDTGPPDGDLQARFTFKDM